MSGQNKKSPSKKSQSKKPRIAIVATGGTIASTASNSAQLADYQVSTGVESLALAVPALNDVADLVFDQVCNIESHEVNDDVLRQLALSVQGFCDRDDIDGVVVTHGTDTLEETAYSLHLAIDTCKPVVMVGAMRPASALSADGPLNLFHAVVVASDAQSKGKGVLVVMNDRIASARHVTKGHANAVDAFVPTEFGYLGLVFGQWVQYQSAVITPHTADSIFKRFFEGTPATDSALLPAVDMILDYQGAGTHQYRAAIESGAKGIVLAATGQGSLSPQARKGALMAKEAGVVVVRSTRVWQGVVRTSEKDRLHDTVAAFTLNAVKARVLLRLALARFTDVPTVRQWFASY